MARQTIFSYIAYDHHGELLGYMVNKPTKDGINTVYHPEGKPMYIRSSEIGRTERYNLQAIMRAAEKRK